MIRVTIDLCPFGDEDHPRELGRLYIANDGSGDRDRGNYTVAVCRKGLTEVPRPINPKGPKSTRAGHVKGYPRLAYNVWRLISRAIRAAFPEEKYPAGVTAEFDKTIEKGLQELGDGYNHSGAARAAGAWLTEAVLGDATVTAPDEA